MAIAGHVSRRMLERSSHIRMEATRAAMETLAASTKTAGYDANHDTNALPLNVRPSQIIEWVDGPGPDRT